MSEQDAGTFGALVFFMVLAAFAAVRLGEALQAATSSGIVEALIP